MAAAASATTPAVASASASASAARDVACQVPDRTDPEGMPLWSTLSVEAEAAAEHQSVYNDKVRAETALQETRAELASATQLCEQQRLELDSLRGRGAALKAASAHAVHAGAPWSLEDELRFTALTKAGESGRHSDGLRELLDLAVVATTSRVSDALREAAHARAESERVDRESLAHLESAFHPSDPARLAARALLVQVLGLSHAHCLPYCMLIAPPSLHADCDPLIAC